MREDIRLSESSQEVRGPLSLHASAAPTPVDMITWCATPSDLERFLPVSSDHSLDRTIETELVPRMMMAHRDEPAGDLANGTPMSKPGPDAKTQAVQSIDVTTFIDLVVGTDDAAAGIFVQRLLERDVSVESVYLDLLGPTATELGARWDDDECSFVDVTVALGRLQRVLRDLSQRFQAEVVNETEHTGYVLLTCLPGEQHTLGLIMVAEFLLRDRFRVLIGAPWSESDLLTQVRSEWFDVIGFSAGCESRLSQLKREVTRIRQVSRNPDVQILVGGQVFSMDAGLVKRVGADGWARDAREAPTVARQLLLSVKPKPRTPAADFSPPVGHLHETVRRQ